MGAQQGTSTSRRDSFCETRKSEHTSGRSKFGLLAGARRTRRLSARRTEGEKGGGKSGDGDEGHGEGEGRASANGAAGGWKGKKRASGRRGGRKGGRRGGGRGAETGGPGVVGKGVGVGIETGIGAGWRGSRAVGELGVGGLAEHRRGTGGGEELRVCVVCGRERADVGE